MYCKHGEKMFKGKPRGKKALMRSPFCFDFPPSFISIHLCLYGW